MNINRQALIQQRNAIKQMIKESPENITIFYKNMVSDGMGGEVEDPTGTEIQDLILCRLDHERKFPGNYNTAPVGLSTNLARFILTDWETEIFVNGHFSAIDKEFRIGAVDPIIKYGGIIAYQAPLIEAISLEAGS